MSESGQPELFEGRNRLKRVRSRKMTITTAVFIFAIIALSGLSISLYGVVQHYHDAKYRAQYVIVSSLVDSILRAEPSIDKMTDLNVSQDDRAAYSLSAYDTLQETKHAANAISVMYPHNDIESSAFEAIELAAGQTQMAVYDYEVHLYSAIRYNETYGANSTIHSLFQNITKNMLDLSALIEAGVDSSRDWQAHPYSLVDRMNLVAVKSTANQIEDDGRLLTPMLQ